MKPAHFLSIQRCTARFLRLDRASNAIPNSVFDDLFAEPIGQLLLKNRRLKLITFDPKQEVIKQWIVPG